MSEDRCICCGAIIPEGVTVCPSCLLAVKPRKEKSRVELKPCPFCGFKIILLYNDNKVLCGNCSAQIKRSSEKKAIEAWNKRAEDGTNDS